MTNCTDSQNSILEVFNIGKRYKNRSIQEMSCGISGSTGNLSDTSKEYKR